FAVAARSLARSRPGYWLDPDMMVAGIGWDEWATKHLKSIRNQLTAGQMPAAQEVAIQRFATMPDDQLLHLLTAQPNLTADEQRAHLSLWSMLSAPLIAGIDVRAMTRDTRDLLTNRDVLAIDQDSLAAALHPLPADPRVLLKSLSDGAVAVALYNAADKPATIATTAAAAGLPAVPCYTVRDMWSHAEYTGAGSLGGGSVAPHAVTLLRVTPRCH
ncbi:MAG: glycoside hydrolase family 27 protein, partial [Mycobacterium sp.]|nr:glycoside hydrolase family 27 protein [Mycobacterium sp.]